MLRSSPLRCGTRALCRVPASSTPSHLSRDISRRASYSTSNGAEPKTQTWCRTCVGASVLLSGLALSIFLTRPSTSSHDKKSRSSSKYASPDEVKTAISALRSALKPDQVLTDPDVLLSYGSSDNTYHHSSPHAVVVLPRSTEDVIEVVNVARQYRVPIVPYSGATSLEGQFAGFKGESICIDMSGMDKILAIHKDDADLVCQAGARWEDINETLKDKGIPLFFPLDPGPGATIGGMVGTGCSGTNAVRYGTARGEWFLNLTVVLPNGKVIKTKRRACKSATGFDTTKLFIGAEGTLGIVTEATLRLAPVLPTRVALAQFPDAEKAVSAVQEILLSPYGSNMQCIEFLDENSMISFTSFETTYLTFYPSASCSLLNVSPDGYPLADPADALLQAAGHVGHDRLRGSAAGSVKTIAGAHSGSNFQFARTDEEAESLWEVRKYALVATLGWRQQGDRLWTTDVCVPVSKLPELVYETQKDMNEHGVTATIVGHVGDGNFHSFMLFHDDKELEKVSAAVHRLVHHAIDLDGTCTGEHGVGLGKKEYLVGELGEGTVELMRSIKQTIDPLNIMNPGKLYPDPSEVANKAVTRDKAV
ncbi:hypothetical protein EWM64_g5473 [Hericium alpestre]|uniref:D-lactate dehydrogenase (cytochrome) n=1 Tax=Hericium alpestre TaxID=135208 RepID=A0A4Y9ZUT2_9AGAM|nr:hypothetical protein EWM64_g5473 [Hericium alpestre]